MRIAAECSVRQADRSVGRRCRRIASVWLAARALPDVGMMLMCLFMSRGIRDIILVVCALICAAAAIYVVYNIEVFKYKYELQFLGQPDQQQ
jgi:hypothetical protein